MSQTLATRAFGALVEEGDFSRTEAKNGLIHVASLSMTKLADGLIDPKLVLSWLMSALGVPAALTSLLVPVREAGALLPQMLFAGRVEAAEYRKWFWVAGTAGQGAAAAVIALAVLMLDGVAAGAVIVAAVAVLAVARAASSVSIKEMLGKTIEKRRRGSVSGAAGSVAAALVIVFALLLMSGLLQSVGALAGVIFVAAGLFALAAILFARVEEEASAPQTERAALDLTPLREDAQFRRFIVVRGCLVASALAPPYLVMLGASNAKAALGQLGAMVLASSLAAFASSWVWGRLADRSSRQVLVASGFFGAAAIGAAPLLALAGVEPGTWLLSGILFVLMIAYHGVRQGRATYLVDMAPEDARARYAALANTVIGGLLLVAGLFGGALSFVGPLAALTGFAVLSALGGGLALGLAEVQGRAAV